MFRNRTNACRYLSILLAFIIILFPVKVSAENNNLPGDSNRETSILFIGNSLTYYNGMPGIFQRIAKSKNRNVYVESLTKSKYILSWFYSERDYASIFNSRKWDYVVLQDGAHVPFDSKEAFTEDITLFDKEIKKINAKTVLFIHNRVGVPEGKVDSELQKPVTDAYTEIGKQLGSTVVPAGPAWVDFSGKYPDVKLYNSDNIHPTLAGSYLDACVFYSALFGESPEGGSTEDLKDTEYADLGLDMQKSAWESTCGYYSINPALALLPAPNLTPPPAPTPKVATASAKSNNVFITSKRFKINRVKLTVSIGKAYLPLKYFKSCIKLPKGFTLTVLKGNSRTPVNSGMVSPGMKVKVIAANKKTCKVYTIIK